MAATTGFKPCLKIIELFEEVRTGLRIRKSKFQVQIQKDAENGTNLEQ